MPKKNVVHIIRTLEVGGCEMALLRMLPLTNDDFSHTMVTLQGEGLLADLFKQENISVIAIKQKNMFDFLSYFRLKKVVQGINPDLVITHLLHADIIGRLYVQYIVTCRLIASIVTTYNFKGYWAARFFERLTKGLANQYMANSNSVKTAYLDIFGVKKEKITVLPRGIDVVSISNTDDIQQLRDECNISLTDRVVICVANLHLNKGHRYLLMAFEKLFNTYPNTKLLIVGEGSEKDRLIAQIHGYQSRKSIHFLGKRNDVLKLLQISDVFVLPTFFEGMSNAIMEAMANELPVVTTDIPENRELITERETGLLCPVKDSDCLVEKMAQLICDKSLAKYISTNAKKEMHTKYNLTITSEAWAAYFSLMAR